MADHRHRAPAVPTRELAALAALAVIAGGFGWAAHRFASRSALVGGLVASLLALVLGVYLVLRAWPGWPSPGPAYRLTRAGTAYIVAVFLVAAAALASANNLLFLVLACMLAALLVSGFVSRMNLAELELQCSVPDEVFAGQDVPMRLSLRNLKSWMPSFSNWLRVELPYRDPAPAPEVYFPMLAGGESSSVLVNLHFPRRGIYQQDLFWLHSGFPFGILVKRVGLRLRREILVYPPVVPMALLETTLPRLTSQWERLLAGLGQDLYRIRPYQTGDSSRVVHWKASAHTGELKVREFTIEEDRRVEVLFDSSVPEGDLWLERFEKAVELCASLVWRLHSLGAGMTFQPGGLEGVYDILRYLALVEPVAEGTPLEVEPSGIFQVIFTAAPLPPSLPESSYYCYALENL